MAGRTGLRRGALVALALAFISRAQGEDWPTYRHDRLRTAVTSEELDLPLQQVWKFRARSHRQAPKPSHSPHHAKYPWLTWYALPISAAGDALFFSSAAEGRAVCLDAAAGKVRWEFLAGAAVNRTPMIWEGKVYVGSDDGHVYCLDAKSGSLVWKRRAAPADRRILSYGKPVSAWPIRTDVLVDDGVAYFCAGVFPHDGTFLYAVDARSGKLLWRNGTQCESGWRVSMAPAGHLFVTEKSIWVPRDCWGYFLNWGTLISFDRSSGRYPARSGPNDDPEFPNQRGHFWPVYGVRKGDVRYLGYEAVTAKWEEENKHERLWRQDVQGRWTDVDSILSVRYNNPTFFRYDPDLCTVIFAGGVLYHTAFEMDLKKGTGSGIYARDPKDGKLLWTADVPERANQLIAANGRLFASTRQGTIYCFAPKGAQAHGTVEEPVHAEPFGGKRPFARIAGSIVGHAGVKEGYALVVDCDGGELAYELAKQAGLYVVATFRDGDKAAAARRAYARAGLHVSRIVAYRQRDGAALPFPSFFADLIVSEAAATGGDLPQDPEGLERMQKPIRGVALIGGQQGRNRLVKWAATTGQAGWAIVGKDDLWLQRIRPPLEGAGSWTHQFGDAGHTNCSHDGALKPPLGVLWYGAPHLEQGGGGPGSWVIDGVFLLPEGGLLVAYDQYTGRELWRREHSQTDTVAPPGSVFLRYLEVVARVDPWTGESLKEYRPPFAGGQWRMMAASPDGQTLYLAAGSKEWNCIQAMDVASGTARWTLGGPGKGTRWGGWNAVGDGYIYILGAEAKDGPRRAEAIAEMRAYLKAHDPERLAKLEKEVAQRDIRVLATVAAATGKVLYERGVDITNCGGRFLPRPNYGTGRYARHYNPNVGPCTIAQKDVVVFCTQSGADKGWGVWPTGRYRQRGIAVRDGATGKLLWNKPANYRTRPVVVDDTIYAEPWGYDLKTGKRKTRIHPATGETADWAWCRSDKQCGIFAASRHFLFGRSLGVGYQDLLTDQGLYTFFHSRMSCSFDAVTGGGLMIKPPQAVYCRCSWSLPFTIALGRVPIPPVVPQSFAQPGLCTPVKHLHIDFGATGDRRDGSGNLWLRELHPPGHKLLIGFDLITLLYEGGGEVRRSSMYTPIDDTDVPFVFATALRGLKRCVVPVTTHRDGEGIYTVRLGFSALPGDKQGQRVSDVRLNGKTVLRDFDIIKEAGTPDRAVWKEFELLLDSDLVIDLVTKSHRPSVDEMPLISGLVVLREKMATLGLDLPGSVLLSRSKPEETVTVALANLRNEPFRGRLVFEAPEHVEIRAPNGGAVTMQPETRTRLSVTLRMTGKVKAGMRTAKVKLVRADGKVALERTTGIEWLGELKRAVLAGSSRSVRAASDPWGRRVRPHAGHGQLRVSRGAQADDDEASAYSYVWFHVPEELRGRIRHARLRLHAAPRRRRIQSALFAPVNGSRSAEGHCWGAVRQLGGPPWPDLNKLAYPNRPAALPEAAALRPTQWDENVVEAPVPGRLDHVGKSHHIYLAIEPTSLNGMIYWSHQPYDRSRAPALLIDYQPRE